MYQLKKIISLLFLLFFANIGNYRPIYSNEITSKMFLQLINSATECSELIPNSRVNPSIFNSDSNIQIVSEIYPYKFGMSELQPISFSLSSPLFNNSAQIKSGISGVFNSIFNQYTIGVAGGVKITDYMSIGSELEYNQLIINKSNSYSAFGVNFGTLIKINNIFDFGLSIKLSNQFEKSEFAMQQMYCGVGLNLTEYLLSDVGFKLDSEDKLSYYFRTKYQITNQIAFRIGYQTIPNTVQFGALIAISNLYSFTINIEKSEFLTYYSFIQLGIKL